MSEKMLKPEQREIAGRIVALSGGVLSSSDTESGYIALKVETVRNSNAVSVFGDHVSFFIRSTDLLNRAGRFSPAPVPGRDHKFRFRQLSLNDLSANETLFKEIVSESIATIIDRQPKRNRR